MILLISRDMTWKGISWFEITSVFFFILFTSLIFLELRDYFNLEGAYLKPLFTVNGFLLIFLPALAFLRSLNSSNNIFFYFLIGVVTLVLSDLMLFITYTIKMPSYFYIVNLVYVVAFHFILKASLQNKLSKKKGALEKEGKQEEVQQSESKGWFR